MDTVKWALELVDKFSPAGKKVAGAFGKIGDAAKKLASKGLTAAGKGMQAIGAKIAEVTPKMAKWAALGALAAGVGLAVAGTRMVADAMSFKDSTLIATKALLKSDALAGNASKRMLDFAHYFGEDPTDAIQRFNAALASGFSAKDAEKLMQSFGDLKLVTPNVNADALVGAFGAIRSKFKLELGDFQAAVSAGGLNLTLAYEAIGKKIGKNAKEVEMLIGAGRVNAKVGLVGLLDAINQRTNSGKAGEKLQEFANTTSGMVARLKNLPQQFMLRLSADDSPIKGTLAKVLGYLDPDGPNGKKIIGALNLAFTKIGGILETWATPEGIEKLSNGLAQAIEVAPKVVKAIGSVASAVNWIADKFGSATKSTSSWWERLKGGSAVAASLGASFFSAVNPVISLGFAVTRWAAVIVNSVTWIGKTASDLATKAVGWGKGMIDGIKKGLSDAWDGLKAQWNKLLESLPASVRSKLEIHSPSRVMTRLGKQMPAGLGAGFVAGSASMSDEIVGALEGSIGKASAATSSMTTTSTTITKSTRGGNVFQFGDVIVPDAKDARAVSRDLYREVQRQFELAALGGA